MMVVVNGIDIEKKVRSWLVFEDGLCLRGIYPFLAYSLLTDVRAL